MRKIHTYLWYTAPDKNIGYLLLRIFIGAAMLTHGWPKLTAGPATWTQLGGVMGNIGVPGPAVFWGFMAAFAESVCAGLLIIGAFTPPAALLIAVTMSVAAFVVHGADGFAGRELALLYLVPCLMFVLKGAGRYSVDGLLLRRN